VLLTMRGRSNLTLPTSREALCLRREYISRKVLGADSLTSCHVKFLLFVAYEDGVLDHSRTSRICPFEEHRRSRHITLSSPSDVFVTQSHLFCEHTKRTDYSYIFLKLFTEYTHNQSWIATRFEKNDDRPEKPQYRTVGCGWYAL
jgi:hypothetical protein